MNIGQGSGIYFSKKDETGGGESLQKTLEIGSETIDQDINLSDGTNLRMEGNSKIVSPIVNNKLTALQLVTTGIVNQIIQIIGASAVSMGIFDTVNGISISVANSNFVVNFGNTLGNKQFTVSLQNPFQALLNFNNTANRTYTFQDKSGTIAMTDDLVYSESFSTDIVNTINATWQAVAVPTAPANRIISIMITNTSASSENGGVRKIGSSLARIGGVQSDSLVITTTTDANSEIEIYSTDLSKVKFNLVGFVGL